MRHGSPFACVQAAYEGRSALLFRQQALILGCILLLLTMRSAAFAGGPRFISGYGMAVQAGQPEGWNTMQLQYFTDPGALAAGVSHAQGDAMVAAAAAVWNVPTSTLSLEQGGTLAEHVSGANSYFDGANFVFPADVEASHENAVPLPILYDTDGSVTDLLLGDGASDPEECRQNAVTQSVDDIQADGHIHHALLVLNGRCVGSAPEQLTQMHYQLARAFGRILGLSWSQLNDNVFTGAATVNADQVAYWPLMHPLDIFCSQYSYQCMPNPFSLRPDDLSALALLYPVLANSVPSGKQASDTDAAYLYVLASFPTGQGMDGLNFTATRQQYGATEDYQVVSGLSGLFYQQSVASPITGAAATSGGDTTAYREGEMVMRVVPVEGLSTVILQAEPINPLYTGDYAIGPYVHTPVTPSGSPQGWVDYLQRPFPDVPLGVQTVATDAASSCSPGNDGAESAPAALDASGWQPGQLCGWGHNSWWSAKVRAGRSWTLEVTALDEAGRATTNKAQTVFGVWNATDPTGTPPTLASGAVPFNALALGMTQVRGEVAASDSPLRIAVGDAYGVGRPDFTYTARLLYADAVSPGTVGAGGGLIVITGTGFQQGNEVTVNGARALVKSWTATTIVAVAPSQSLAGAELGTTVNITVTDLGTGGATTITSALRYTGAPDTLQRVAAPTAIETGVTASVPFSVRVLASDGTTPLSGASVRFSSDVGTAILGLCGGAAACTGVTDEQGVVQTTVTGVAPGTATLTATEMSGGAQVSVTVVDTEPAKSVMLSSTSAYIAAGASDTWILQLTAIEEGSPVPGVPISWAAGNGLALASTMAATGADTVTTAVVTSNGVEAGTVSTFTGCAWSSFCATWTLYGVDIATLHVTVEAGAGQNVPQGNVLGGLQVLVTDPAGHPVQDASLTVHQRVLGWEGLCTTPGRCPAAPVLDSTEAVVRSGVDGSVALQPLQVAGVPQTVEIAITWGNQGLLTLTLVKTPQ